MSKYNKTTNKMIQKYPDFWHVLIGNGSLGSLLAYATLAFGGAILAMLIEVSNRDVASKNTPVILSWKFFWAHNIARIAADVLLLPITIRICYEYVPYPFMVFLAIAIGLGVDGLAIIAKNAGLLATNKLAEKVRQKLASDDHTIAEKP